MITYNLLSGQPDHFKQFTGLSPAEFEALLARLVAAPGRTGPRRRLTLQRQLLMTLMWRQLSLNTTALGSLFGVDRSTASRATRQIQAELSRLGPQPLPLPAPPGLGQGKGIEQALADYPPLQTLLAASQPATPAQSAVGLLPANTPPFQNLSPGALQAVTRAAAPRRVARHGYFFHQGDPATMFYILVEGRVRLTEVTPEGQQLLVRFVRPGEAIGIIAAMEQSIYPLAAQALEDCTALAWDSNTLERLMERFPRIAINGLRLVARRWYELEERYRELATERVERRIAQTLLRLAHQVGRREEQGILIDLPLTRQDLAEMTGTTLYTVSRIISRWEDEQLVESARERILIRYPHGLTLIAEDLPPDSPAGPTDLSPSQKSG